MLPIVSNIASRKGTARVFRLPYQCSALSAPLPPPLDYSHVIHVWTDGSALANGLDTCTAGAAWVSNIELQDSVALSGVPLSNNIAELAAIVLCLMAWRGYAIVVHTDSSYSLKLVTGGLLERERNGWIDLPCGPQSPLPLFLSLLSLCRSHGNSLTFVKAKAHSGDGLNDSADALANLGRLSGRPFDISSLTPDSAWVDALPVLSRQSLKHLTVMVNEWTTLSPHQSPKFLR